MNSAGTSPLVVGTAVEVDAAAEGHISGVGYDEGVQVGDEQRRLSQKRARAKKSK